MNILFLSHYYPPEVNAPATRTYEHCKRWVTSGHKVTVVTCAPNCPDGKVYKGYKNRFSSEQVDGVEIRRVWTYLAPNKGFLKRILNFLSYLVATFIYCIRMKNVDVVIATSPQFFCGWAGVVLGRLRGWPFILEIRDIWPESIVTVGAMKKSMFIKMLEILEKRMYAAALHIVAVGEGYKKKIVEKGIDPDKISVIVNGVDITRFTHANTELDMKKRYCAENKFVCSYIGTVGMAHGLEVVLEASKMCKTKDLSDVVFWIVGDGAQREELELRAQKESLQQVIFTGRLPKETMPDIIAASDCSLVHLRGTELFGTVIPSKIFELMAMDVPIVMAVKGEALDIVEQSGAGIAMEPDNPQSLLDCIATIKKRGRVAFSGRTFVEKNFNRDVLAQGMLEIIEKVVEGQ